jgi:hypothetical protein
MAVQIQWKRGEFHTFYPQMKIRVGGHNGSEPVDLLEGDEFEYDGTICKYQGREFPQPQIRACIRDGWATLDPEGHKPGAFVATRDVAVSQSKSTDLSRVKRHERQVMTSDSLDEDTVLNVSDRSAVRDPRSGRGHLTAKDNKRAAVQQTGFQVTQSDIDEQDGVEVAKVRSAAKLKVDLINNPGITRDIENRSVDDGYGRANRIGQRTTTREGVTIVSNVGRVSKDIDIGDEQDGTVVARVRHTDKPRKASVHGDITVEDTSGPQMGKRSRVASEPAPAPRASAKPQPARVVQSKAPAKAPAKKTLPANASPKLKEAFIFYQDFPVDWNFFAKPSDKVARVKKLGSNPDLVKALYAIESPAMKKVLKEEFDIG